MKQMMKVHWLSDKMTIEVFLNLAAENGWFKGSAAGARMKVSDVIKSQTAVYSIEEIASMIWTTSEFTEREEILAVLRKYEIPEENSYKIWYDFIDEETGVDVRNCCEWFIGTKESLEKRVRSMRLNGCTNVQPELEAV